METFEEKLIRIAPDVESKMYYHRNKLLGKKSEGRNYISRFLNDGRVPKIIGEANSIVSGVSFTFIYVAYKYTQETGLHIICIPFARDIKRYLYSVTRVNHIVTTENEVGDRILKETIEFVTTKISHHYLERFDDRNHPEVLRCGGSDRAALCDLFCRVEGGKVVGTSFKNVQSIGERYSEKDLDSMIDFFSELSGEGVDKVMKYLNFREGTAILRTRSGFGIYKNQGNSNTMITYISEDMIGKDQERLFNFIT